MFNCLINLGVLFMAMIPTGFPSSTSGIGETTSAPAQTQLIQNICQNVMDNLQHDVSNQFVNFNHDQLQDIESLNQALQGIGYAERIGEDLPCRITCVSWQGALEGALAFQISMGKIRVKACYLTPDPCTPLRNSKQEFDSEKPLDPKTYTVNKRTQAVRALREAGAEIIIAYDAQKYQNQPNMTYEIEKVQDRIFDRPLNNQVPADLTGALYVIQDTQSHQITYIATQGVQIQNAANVPNFHWKIWFSLAKSNLQTDNRIEAMQSFIKAHAQQDVSFDW